MYLFHVALHVSMLPVVSHCPKPARGWVSERNASREPPPPAHLEARANASQWSQMWSSCGPWRDSTGMHAAACKDTAEEESNKQV